MLILIIGKSHTAKAFAHNLSLNKNNIVFITTKCEGAAEADINPHDIFEIKDFVCANEISLLVVADKEYVNLDFSVILNETECLCLCPNAYSSRLFAEISAGKKFIYKNKIPTAKFAVFEKAQQAIDYLKEFNLPAIIMPDNIYTAQPPYIAETKKQAENQIDFLLQTGNRKFLIENFTSGTTYTKYLISDGINFIDAIDCISYFEDTATNNVGLIPLSIREKIQKEYVPNILNSFFEEGIEYLGVLGLTFAIGKDGAYFTKFKPFFDELEGDIFLNLFSGNLEKLLYSAATGELAEKYPVIELAPKYAISANKNGEIITSCANTMSGAIDIISFEGIDKKEIKEAILNWKK